MTEARAKNYIEKCLTSPTWWWGGLSKWGVRSKGRG